MNRIKKYIAILLCVAIAFTMPISAFAGEFDTDIIPIGGGTKPTTPADKSALLAVIEIAEKIDANDYSAESIASLETVVSSAKTVSEKSKATQSDVDNATTELVTEIGKLVPYLALSVTSKSNAPITVTYEKVQSNEPSHTILYGTEVTLSAPMVTGCEFAGWFDTVSKRYLAYDKEYTFVISTNLSLEAKYEFVSNASIICKNASGQVVATITKAKSTWNTIDDISALLPAVPYSYGKTEGWWEYNNDDVLALLRQESNAEIIAAYNEGDVEDVAVENNSNYAPAGKLSFDYNSEHSKGSFIMNVNIPNGCRVNAIGVAFSYGNNEFDPTNVVLNLNNKNVVSQFNTDELENTYIVNVATQGRNWASVGFVTYFNQDGKLVTYYTNQVNVVNNEWVK